MKKDKIMPQVMDIKDHYLEAFGRFEKEQRADEPSPLYRLRESAIAVERDGTTWLLVGPVDIATLQARADALP